MIHHCLFIACLALVAANGTLAEAIAGEQLGAAAALRASLSGDQLQRVSLPFDSDRRTEWSYFPWGHTGVPLSDLSQAQREAVFALLAGGLGSHGLRKAKEVMALEREESGWLESLLFDPQGYFTVLFGTPAGTNDWSWRFEGHHLSVNVTHSGGQVVAATPYFIGADPAVVTEGPLAGLRILGSEEVEARDLLLSMNPQQRASASLRAEAPQDIVTGNDPIVDLPCCEGIGWPLLNERQQTALMRLVELITGHLHPDLATIHRDRVLAAGVEHLHFAWAGSAEPGQPHYYRIQGPSLLIEYDNSQNNANHIHLVLRDPSLDFGGAPMREHLRHEH
ncbi:MAG: DUF3500 domain-containing protein [Pseudomonadota bacterium]